MAFCILVELNKNKADWKVLNKDLDGISNDVLDLFPIPNSPKTGKDYIGISIPNRNFTESDLECIRVTIKRFLQDEHKVVELYSSSMFTMENVDMLTMKFFKPGIK
jgi:hypothetical protein